MPLQPLHSFDVLRQRTGILTVSVCCILRGATGALPRFPEPPWPAEWSSRVMVASAASRCLRRARARRSSRARRGTRRFGHRDGLVAGPRCEAAPGVNGGRYAPASRHRLAIRRVHRNVLGLEVRRIRRNNLRGVPCIGGPRLRSPLLCGSFPCCWTAGGVGNSLPILRCPFSLVASIAAFLWLRCGLAVPVGRRYAGGVAAGFCGRPALESSAPESFCSSAICSPFTWARLSASFWFRS